MRFKLDENLPVELVTDLRDLGHDADTVADEGLRGAADPCSCGRCLCCRSDLVYTRLRVSPISSAIRFTNMRERCCFDLTPRDEAPSSRLCASGYIKCSKCTSPAA